MEGKKLTILAFVGPSGAGKTSLMVELVRRHPERFAVLLSTTTRPSRDPEKDPNDAIMHRFVTLPEMDRLRAEDAVWAPVEFPPGSGKWYAVQKADAARILAEGRVGVIAFVESVVETYRKEGFEVLTVHVKPRNAERLVDRADDPRRAAADAAREAQAFEHTYELENDFSEGGFERTLAHLAELLNGL